MASMTSRPMTLDVEGAVSGVVVHIVGSVSMTDAEALRQRLETLASERAPVIVLDLAGMDFICSLGLGAMIAGHLRCRHHHGQIRLAGPTPPVRKLLETTRLNAVLPVYDDVQKALSGA